ncbi:MAG: hypothetical protein AB9907_12415 [Flexilinea sp.]
MNEKTLKWFYRLSLAEGVGCFGYYLLSPGGSGEGQLFAFSKIRLAFIALTFMGILKCLIPLVNHRCFEWFQAQTRKSAIRFFLLIWSQILILGGITLLRTCWLLYHSTDQYSWFAAYQRLFPMILWLILICIQLLILLSLNSIPQIRASFSSEQKKWRIFAVLMLIGIVLGCIIAYTRIGLVKDNNFFGKPTVPLLEWHLAAGFIFSLSWILLEQWRKKPVPKLLIRALPFLIWLLAVGIWLSIPNQEGFFSPPGRAPNFEVYPFSDGSFYGHYARSLAEGMGFKGNDIPPRPLYIVLLAIFHLIGGNQYGSVIVLQTLLLGLLPVLVYQIGKELHGIGAGMMAAWLIILRETNAILSAPFGHNVSTTKYFFSDLPTALAAAFFVWMLVRWLKKQDENPEGAPLYALLSGGALGIMTLIRTQSLSLLLIVLLITLSGIKKDFKRWLLQLGLFGTALLCCLLPWLIRNQQITGKLIFDHPMTQTGEMAASYNLGGLDLSRPAGMNDGEYTDKLTNTIRQSIMTYPVEILTFIGMHFFNNEISNLRLFPLRDELNSPQELLRPKTAFWETLENDKLGSYNLIFLGLSYAVIALGVAAAKKNTRRAGLIPLLVCLLYNFSTAVGRYSAGRYLIPLDWTLFLYFAIGASEWILGLLRVSGHEIMQNSSAWVVNGRCSLKYQPVRYAGFLVAFLLVGLSLPLSERLIPMRFVPAEKQEVFEKLGLDPADYSGDDLIVKKSIAIYPRYYAAGEGEPESAKQGYGVSDYGRLVFLTLSPNGFDTTELITNTIPEYFPDGSTVWMISRENGATSLAEVVLVECDNGDVTYYWEQ